MTWIRAPPPWHRKAQRCLLHAWQSVSAGRGRLLDTDQIFGPTPRSGPETVLLDTPCGACLGSVAGDPVAAGAWGPALGHARSPRCLGRRCSNIHGEIKAPEDDPPRAPTSQAGALWRNHTAGGGWHDLERVDKKDSSRPRLTTSARTRLRLIEKRFSAKQTCALYICHTDCEAGLKFDPDQTNIDPAPTIMPSAWRLGSRKSGHQGYPSEWARWIDCNGRSVT